MTRATFTHAQAASVTVGQSYGSFIEQQNDYTLLNAPPRPRLGLSVPLPTAAEWHSSDASSSSSSPASLCYLPSIDSPSTVATSPPSSRASSPATSYFGSPTLEKKSVSRRVAKDPTHIPRPRNAFILFRSAKCQELKELERDHRMISRIIAAMWKNAPPQERSKYKMLAAEEKKRHTQMYPGYRFNPKPRVVPPRKRKVKRNGASDKQRCKLVADLLLKGKGGDDLKAEVDKFDLAVQEEQARQVTQSPSDDYTTVVFHAKITNNGLVSPTSQLNSSPSPSSLSSTDASSYSETPFRSPLLPPATPPPPAELQIELSSPLSPLQFSPQPQLHNYAVEYLSNEDALLSQSASYSTISSTATPFGAMQAHEPQGSLALSNMYTVKSTQIVTSHTQDYTFPNKTYLLGLHVPIDPAFSSNHQVPSAGFIPAQVYQPVPLPQPQIIFTNPFAPRQMAEFAPETFGEPQPPEFWPYAPDLVPSSFGEYVPSMDTWQCAQSDGLEVSVQAEPSHLQTYMASF